MKTAVIRISAVNAVGYRYRVRPFGVNVVYRRYGNFPGHVPVAGGKFQHLRVYADLLPPVYINRYAIGGQGGQYHGIADCSSALRNLQGAAAGADNNIRAVIIGYIEKKIRHGNALVGRIRAAGGMGYRTGAVTVGQMVVYSRGGHCLRRIIIGTAEGQAAPVHTNLTVGRYADDNVGHWRVNQ